MTMGEISDAPHDSFVVQAFNRLPAVLADRALAEFSVWLADRRAVMAAAARGVRVAPMYGRPLHEQLKLEGDRRAQLDDRAWIVWDAWAESVRLAVEFPPG